MQLRRGCMGAMGCGLLLALACGPQQTGAGAFLLNELTITGVSPGTWLRGTRVVVEGTGFARPGIGTMTATIRATAGDSQVSFRIDLAVDSETRGSFTVDDAVLALLPVDGPAMTGTLSLDRSGERQTVATTQVAFEATVLSRLTPMLSQVLPSMAYPGEIMSVSGDGFLMQGEGITLVRISGQFKQQGYSSTVIKQGLYLPLEVTDRNNATFRLTPDLLGLLPGAFDGEMVVLNQLAGEDLPGNTLPGIRITMGLPFISAIAPASIRRGQELVFEGRGFLGLDGDLGTTTFIAFTGTKTTAAQTTTYMDANPLVFVPDRIVGNTVARMVVRVQAGGDGGENDFAIHPGVLEGTFTPHVLFGDKMVVGQGIPARLEVGRQVQVVYVRFMPTFEAGLRAFGLEMMSDRVKQRVLDVCRQDYQGISIEFRSERPTDFVEFMTAEVMGSDPNDAGLLGLDNSFGKDVGNLRFDDLVGGYSAQSEEAGYYPYGGVFVSSFRAFSPSLAGKDGSMVSAAFDQVFSAFMPELGGQPVEAGEYPGGARDAGVDLAVQVMGNLIGDTLSHEVGHSLGLAAVEGDYHDPGDNPGYIMDAGAFRPFEERAQLVGAFPRVFAPYDRAYLEEVLPAE